MRIAAYALTLVLGLVAGVAALVVHRSLLGLVLGLATAVVTIAALRRWLRRAGPVFAAGWLLVPLVAVSGRAEGDYVIASDLLGWLYLASAFVVLVTGAVWSSPPSAPRRSGSRGAAT